MNFVSFGEVARLSNTPEETLPAREEVYTNNLFAVEVVVAAIYVIININMFVFVVDC